MVERVGDNLFEAIRVSLVDFRKAVEGDAGNKLKQMGGVEGPIANLIRMVLQQFYQATYGFYKLMNFVEAQLIQGDGCIACLEVFSGSIDPLSDPAVLEETSEALGLPKEPFTLMSQIIGGANDLLKKGLEMTEVLPSPEAARDIRRELERLLGVPEESIEGTYVKLLEALNVSLPQLPAPDKMADDKEAVADDKENK